MISLPKAFGTLCSSRKVREGEGLRPLCCWTPGGQLTYLWIVPDILEGPGPPRKAPPGPCSRISITSSTVANGFSHTYTPYSHKALCHRENMELLQEVSAPAGGQVPHLRLPQALVDPHSAWLRHCSVRQTVATALWKPSSVPRHLGLYLHRKVRKGGRPSQTPAPC